MKYAIQSILGSLVVAMLFLMSFKTGSSSYAEQQIEIKMAVQENLSMFVAQKDADCKEMALREAIKEVRIITGIPIKELDKKPKTPTVTKPSTTTTGTTQPSPEIGKEPEVVPPAPVEEPKPEPGTADDPGAKNLGKKNPTDTIRPPDTGVINKGKKNTSKKGDGNQ